VISTSKTTCDQRFGRCTSGKR